MIFSDPPRFDEHPSPTNGTADSFVTLDCEVYGHPLPNITWFKGNSVIVSDDEDETMGSAGSIKYLVSFPSPTAANKVKSELRIEALEYEDNGEYQCRAVNSLFETRTAESIPGALDVHCKIEKNV